MLISKIFAWLTVIFAVLTCLKFIARISGSKPLNAFFRSIHIPIGWLLCAAGLLHGIFAGNPSFATISDFTPAAALFTLNFGSACIVLAAVTALTYVLRRRLKKLWFPIHRIAAAAMALCLVLHIIDTGITLPSVIYQSFIAQNPSDAAPEITAQRSDENATTNSPEIIQSETAQSETAQSETAQSETPNSSETTQPETTTSPETTQPSSVTFAGAQLADGVYEGAAQGYGGTITVLVTVSGGAVTAVEVVRESETDRFFERAKALLDTILGSQTLEVDAISGATYSSAGLINAVYDALSDAVTSGTLEVNEIDLSNIRAHGGH